MAIAPARTRHIHRRWFFTRYYISAGKVYIQAVKGAFNPANMLTKPSGGAQFKRDRLYLMGSPGDQHGIALVEVHKDC